MGVAFCSASPISRSMRDFLTFASQADILALWGGAFVLLALAALGMERRRMSRKDFDRVGWVPWTGLFLTFAVLGGGLLTAAIPSILQG